MSKKPASAPPICRSNIHDLVPYVPGKPIEEVEREYGITDIIKLASNENPYGPSPRVVEAMKKALDNVRLYPDGSCYALTKRLSEHLNVPTDHIVVGNGSDEIIHYLGIAYLEPGDEVVQAHPSFVRYEAAAILNGCQCIQVPLKDYTHDLDAMADAVTPRTKLLFITNPNNPTGTIVTRSAVDRLLDRIPERVLVVMDEAYYEYVEDPEYPDSLAYIREGRNVISLRTFSKIFALAGLRVGYGIARPEIIWAIHQVREPFNVNSIAQVGAIACLDDPDQVERGRRVNRDGRTYLYAVCERLGLPYVPSQANFVFIDVKADSRVVFQELLRRGVIVRTGDIFGHPTHLRVTVGTPEENARFVRALEEVLAALK
ncbi:MAG TPA: histidinol-phosphate transaminase [Armatimonadota bacterium]|nr:histidinol-phosphate transaminase [Armatimonadota bacterium]HOM80324.1 histidinol-phosphate transaminase [Armatimonadota bacterium]HPO71839.1 histidinol-phosphate transaminase [Armatimonadota bacterium]HPT98301.1 histidinol-phosphate transaminase [Armatimonadota bacterium]